MIHGKRNRHINVVKYLEWRGLAPVPAAAIRMQHDAGCLLGNDHLAGHGFICFSATRVAALCNGSGGS